MISRIDHVSIAVSDLEKAVRFFTGVFGAVGGVGETDHGMKYNWRIYSLGDLSRLELLSPTGEGSFLDNFLRKHPTGAVHHITLETPNLAKAAECLEENNIPYFGFSHDGPWKELFIHPRDAFGVLIQIAQFNPSHYLDDSQKLAPGIKWEVEKRPEGAALNLAHSGGGKLRLKLTRREISALISELEQTL